VAPDSFRPTTRSISLTGSRLCENIGYVEWGNESTEGDRSTGQMAKPHVARVSKVGRSSCRTLSIGPRSQVVGALAVSWLEPG
jgi:hypothetical protein